MKYARFTLVLHAPPGVTFRADAGVELEEIISQHINRSLGSGYFAETHYEPNGIVPAVRPPAERQAGR